MDVSVRISRSDPAAAKARRRSLLLAAAIAAGVIAAVRFDAVEPALMFSASLLVTAAAMVLPKRAAGPVLLLALCCASIGWVSYRLGPPASDSIAHALPSGASESIPLVVEGIAVTDSTARLRSSNPMRRFARPWQPGATFTLRVHSMKTKIGWQGVTGSLRVGVDSLDARQVRAGQAMRVSGRARQIDPPRNPGERDWRALARQSGLAGNLNVPSPALIAAPEREVPTLVRARTWWPSLRAWASRSSAVLLERTESDAATPRGRALLGAILLGARTEATEGISDSFREAGVAHLLAISGFHVAVMVGVALLLTRATGDHGRWEAVLLIALIAAYMIALPARPSVVRAGFMAIALIGAHACGRRWDPIAVLALVGSVMLIVRPLDLFSPGFQLSFGLVSLLIAMAQRERLGLDAVFAADRSPAARLIASCTTQVRATAACWIVSTPAVMYWFGMVSISAVLASIVTVPLVTFAMYASVLAVGVGVIVPPLAPVVGSIADVLGNSSVGVVAWIDSVPYSSVLVPGVPLSWTIFATVVAVWTALGPTRRAAWMLSVFAVVVWLVVWWVAPLRPQSELRIDSFDVGDGSCHLLRSGGDTVMWDCGGFNVEIGEDIVDALRSMGVSRVDRVVITHGNTDHFVGILEIARRLPLKDITVGESFLERAADRPSGPEAYVLRELKRYRVPVSTVSGGDEIPIGNHVMRMLWPARDLEASNENDRSLVAHLRIETENAPRTVLLTGDIGPGPMQSLSGLGPVDVLELPHHGSYSDTALNWVMGLRPSVVLQSTGRRRSEDPRWDRARANTAWLETARDGAFTTQIFADGRIEVSPLR